MRTTEIFVEQVLIGLLVLTAGALPLLGPTRLGSGIDNLAEGAALIVAAYLVGILFDRFADSLLARIDDHHRARFATERGLSRFPRGKLRAEIRKSGSAATNEWMDYLRSRIRLCRALTVFLPALTVSGLLAAVPTGAGLSAAVLAWAALVYAAAFLRVVWLLGRKPGREFRWLSEPPVQGLALLGAAALALALAGAVCAPGSAVRASAVLLIGFGLSALASWAWWRISETFLEFLLRATS